jgi:3-hydroxymyristoyl/3-hydroxydecanoyl-(acyl carrier protein) dehydratase
VYNESVIEKTDNSALLEFTALESWDYFDGHFPGFKLLPAVAQIEIVVRLASKYFNSSIFIQQAKRLKFSSIIQANTRVQLSLSYKKESQALNFSMKSPAGDTVYSSGILTLGTGDYAG